MKYNHQSNSKLNLQNIAISRCLDEDILIPNDQPIFCQASTKRDDFFVACCDDFDGCNANLTLPNLTLAGMFDDM